MSRAFRHPRSPAARGLAAWRLAARRLAARRLTAVAVIGAAMACALATAAPADAQSAVHYVALGDSYSAGVGAGSYIGSSGSCDRSSNAYSELWARANKPASYVSVACSDATTSSVISSQLSALSKATTLVSVTIGGNDAGFATTMETCVLESTSRCVAAVAADETVIAAQLPGRLDDMLAGIGRDAPRARVVVLGYPRLYDLSRSASCIGLSTTDRTDLNQAAGQLDRAIRTAAARYRDVFADVRPAFAGHAICDFSPWLHSVSFLDPEESYHPTAAGQADAYLPVFSQAAS